MPISREKFKESADQLELWLNESRAENERLAQQIEHAEGRLAEQIKHSEERVRQAEERASAAEQRATDAQEKLRILEDLKTKQYQTVVSELFQQPSRQAAVLTVAVAVISIVIGLVQSIMTSRDTRENSAEMIAEISQLLNEQAGQKIDQIEKRAREEILQSEKRAEQKITQSEERVKKEIGKAAATVPAEPLLALASLRDLKNNEEIEFPMRLDENRYYRITVPPGRSQLRVTLFPSGGDADFDLFYGSLPTPKPVLSAKHNASATCTGRNLANQEDLCVRINPSGGDWFLRVHALSSAKVRLKTVF